MSVLHMLLYFHGGVFVKLLLLQPCLVGKARVPFRQWLMAGATSTIVAPVTTSFSLGGEEGGEGGREGGSDEESVGKLTVRTTLSLTQ